MTLCSQLRITKQPEFTEQCTLLTRHSQLQMGQPFLQAPTRRSLRWLQLCCSVVTQKFFFQPRECSEKSHQGATVPRIPQSLLTIQQKQGVLDLTFKCNSKGQGDRGKISLQICWGLEICWGSTYDRLGGKTGGLRAGVFVQIFFFFTICLLSPWDVTSQTSKVPNQAQSPHALIPQACSSCHFPFPSHFLHSPKAQVECLGLLPSSSGPFHPNY